MTAPSLRRLFSIYKPTYNDASERARALDFAKRGPSRGRRELKAKLSPIDRREQNHGALRHLRKPGVTYADTGRFRGTSPPHPPVTDRVRSGTLA